MIKQKCPTCKGTGKVKTASGEQRCQSCGGNRVIVTEQVPLENKFSGEARARLNGEKPRIGQKVLLIPTGFSRIHYAKEGIVELENGQVMQTEDISPSKDQPDVWIVTCHNKP